jgi:hypothetical protein
MMIGATLMTQSSSTSVTVGDGGSRATEDGQIQGPVGTQVAPIEQK